MNTKIRFFFSIISILSIFSCKSISPIKHIKNRKLTTPYTDIVYKPVEKVSLEPYKSVQTRKGQNPELALGISIGGGGSRAQFFGTGVLIGLDEINNDSTSFLNEIDYFSTVSGGGFGVGYYLTMKKHDMLGGFKRYFDFWKSPIHKEFYKDELLKNARATNIVTKFPFQERNWVMFPYPTVINEQLLQVDKPLRDTNGKLVLDGNSNTKYIKELNLKDIYIPAGSDSEVTLPMLVTNGAMYSNGERFPFMPHIISDLKIKESLLPHKVFSSTNGYDFPLNYAITGSASFPGVLPMLKLTVEGKKDSVIRIIDGGVIDNLGAKTLLELMDSKKDKSSKKSAIVVNCSGSGLESSFVPNKKLRLYKLIEQSALYALATNLLNSNHEMKSKFDSANIGFREIGFQTIKFKLLDTLNHSKDTRIKSETEDLKEDMRKHRMKWRHLCNIFVESLKNEKYTDKNLSEIPREEFEKFNTKQIFCIFELSAQVPTRLSIGYREKEILVLAGRYAVFLQRKEMEKLL